MIVDWVSDPQVVQGPDGIRYQLVITGAAEIVRGPLGRIVDLCDQITAEGLPVPPEILAVLEALQQPQPESES